MRPTELEERLITFGVETCRLIRRLPRDVPGHHVCMQLVRSGTSPAANYAEARGAESRRDFVHKLQICTKELRETSVWLRLSGRLWDLTECVNPVARECDQLIAILVRSIQTAQRPRARAASARPANS